MIIMRRVVTSEADMRSYRDEAAGLIRRSLEVDRVMTLLPPFCFEST